MDNLVAGVRRPSPTRPGRCWPYCSGSSGRALAQDNPANEPQECDSGRSKPCGCQVHHQQSEPRETLTELARVFDERARVRTDVGRVRSTRSRVCCLVELPQATVEEDRSRDDRSDGEREPDSGFRRRSHPECRRLSNTTGGGDRTARIYRPGPLPEKPQPARQYSLTAPVRGGAKLEAALELAYLPAL